MAPKPKVKGGKKPGAIRFLLNPHAYGEGSSHEVAEHQGHISQPGASTVEGSSRSVSEHEGRTAQQGVPSGPRQTYAPTGPSTVAPLAGPPSPATAPVKAAPSHVVARQRSLVKQYVTKAYSQKVNALQESKVPGYELNDRISKAKEEVSSLRDRLLNHPTVEAANAEGKVVKPTGLAKIHTTELQRHAIEGPKGVAHSSLFGLQPRSLQVGTKGLKELQGATGTEGSVGRTQAEAKSKAQAAGGLDLGGIVKTLTHHLSVLPSNPFQQAAKSEGKNLVDVVKENNLEGLPGTGNHVVPDSKQLRVLNDALLLSPAGVGSDVAKAGEGLAGLATREGAAKVAAKAASVKGGLEALAHAPGEALDALKAAPKALPDVLKAGVKETPAALKGAAKAAPGAAGRYAARGVESSVHSLSGIGAVAATQKAGVHTPVGQAASAFLEGTDSALQHHPGEVLATTARSIPGFITAPASLIESGVESAVTGSPKPFENTAKAIGAGTYEMGKELASGNPKEVEESIRKKVGVTPFVPVPAFLHHAHESEAYGAVRGVGRSAVDNLRERRKGAAPDATGRHPTTGKTPKPAVAVRLGSKHGPHENYVFGRLGEHLEGRKARQNVALDTTRATEQGHVEEQMVGRHVASGFRKGKTLSSLHRKIGEQYEGTVGLMAKYGIPHTAEGHAVAAKLAEVFGDATHAPLEKSWTDRMAANALAEHPEILNDIRHKGGVEALREVQHELSSIRSRNDVAPHRVQNDLTNVLSREAGLAPVLKDTERVPAEALKHTSPGEAAAALTNEASRLRARAEKSKSEAKTKALEGEAARLEQHATDLTAGNMVSREGLWHHYAELNREHDKLRKEGRTEEAKGVLKQKKAIYAQLKQYGGFKLENGRVVKTAMENSKLPLSSRPMRNEFRGEQNARASHFGLHEPVYIKDRLPGNPLAARGDLRVERPFPGLKEHAKPENVLARSGEAESSLRGVLEHSAMNPRTRMAVNKHIYTTVNEAKIPVKVGDSFKHVMTVEEADRAKRDGTWPPNAVAVDLGMVKQAALGPHGLTPEEAAPVLSVATEDAAAGASLKELPTSLREEIEASEGRTGRKIIAADGAAVNELKDQFTNSSNHAWRNIRKAANVPTRLILNDPAWVFAQIFAKGIPIGSVLGPGALLHAAPAIKAMGDIQKMDIHSQAIIKSIMGSSRGVRGTPGGAFEHQDPFAEADVLRHSSVGKKVWNLANGNVMGKWDRWNAAKMREFAAAVRSSKGFRNWYGGVRGLDKSMRQIVEATKGMGTAERLDYIGKHPEMARAVQRHINQMGGNWNSFTAMERKVAPFTIFYPWIRYSLDWTFHTFPVNHPVAATALAFLSQRNANELQALAANAERLAGNKKASANTALSDFASYAEPVTRNANNEAEVNPSGQRYEPGWGVIPQTAVSNEPIKAIGGLNPIIAAGISAGTGTDLFTGGKLSGHGIPGFIQNFGEQLGELSPAARTAKTVSGFRGFGAGPQSSTSRAYEILAGGKAARVARSVAWPYLKVPAEKTAMKNALDAIDQRIFSTGNSAQSAAEWNLSRPTKQNQAEAEKLKATNKKAWEEKEKLLRRIDPSLAKQSKAEYEHYLASKPAIGGSSKGTSFGSSFGSGFGSGFGSSFGGSSGAKNLPPYKPPTESLHLPNIPGLSKTLGAIGSPFASLIGGEKAQAAGLKGKQVQKAIASLPAQNERAAAPLVVAAAQKYGLKPSLLMAQLKQESGFNPAAKSSAGAQGISQFIPSTAKSYGVKYGTSPAAVKSQVEGQARYMATLVKENGGNYTAALNSYLGAGGSTPTSYSSNIQAMAKEYAALDKGGKVKTPYANPLPGWSPGRSDQGYDASPTKANQPVLAVAKSKVIAVGAPGWPEGGGVTYKLLEGPQKGKTVYAFEGLNATVRPGQIVKRGQVVAKGRLGGSIEMGYYVGNQNIGGHPLNNQVVGTGQTYSVSSTDGQQTVGSRQFEKQILGNAVSVPASGGSAGFIVTGPTVAAYSQATGTPPKTVAKQLKARTLKPKTMLQKLAQVEQILSGNMTKFGIPGMGTPGRPSVSTIAELGKSLEAGRQELASL